ncbi:hypothetical protein BJ742DRAFT_324526 [Cladochytrium replicatum]|nr:hypothetical protein BJ742DRAFT_324526 [Cladochytrium replicatum]
MVLYHTSVIITCVLTSAKSVPQCCSDQPPLKFINQKLQLDWKDALAKLQHHLIKLLHVRASNFMGISHEDHSKESSDSPAVRSLCGSGHPGTQQ